MVKPPPRPNTHQIQAFAHTVREGSVSAAARVLGVTQGAISQHLKKLERASGTQLLVFTRDGVELTRTGFELFGLADSYLAAERMIAEKLGDLTQMYSGNLSLIANASEPAMSIVSRFCDAFPGVRIDFSLVDWTTALEMLKSRTVDVGVVASPRQTADFVSTEIARLRYVLYMRADHALARRRSVSLADLRHERLILPEDGSLTQRVMDAAMAQEGIRFERIMTMRTFPLIKDAIRHGIGVGPFLERSVSFDEGLVGLPIDELTEAHPIKVVVHRDKSRLNMIEHFVRTAVSTA
jgi:DNA-binding transcriptional LysR family regulator